ncbi:phosphoribosyl 1,2-cyclic phosphodiesterase [Polymorphobacter glacialis]|uniref:Phosphoribosyl 1,2-cyclic phosphodiesterase n=1 Tax=Sandarakinorhabdus glacialis TaxID=1614636 RepID=A0A916ZMA8_9SPHN|nr:MBL fold metallo-hydrolase [Polymorphobacter glacialis]GGE04571.1 phosphoribosyl 1,2-cyclic phosphodiesterase [Polymorphobacter glacialis]
MKITILGCGTSSGVPRIGGPDGAGDWGACDPAEPKNRRRRVSLLIEHGGKTVLIDTGPDLREQLLSARVRHLDAVFLTHDHADHSHGIDDLRQVFHAMGEPVACFASAATWGVLRERFGYVFAGTKFYPPTCTAADLVEPMRVGEMLVTGFEQNHGNIDSTGYRIEAAGRALVYSTDVKTLDERAYAMLAGLDLWVVDALRRAPHPSHSHLAQTLEWIAEYRPERAVLTHMDQSMDYAGLVAELPAGVEPGFDGLVVELG